MAGVKVKLKGEDEVRRFIPDFDLYRLDQIVRLLVEIDANETMKQPVVNVSIRASYRSTEIMFVTLLLRDVRDLEFPRVGPYPAPSFSELEVHDISERMWERVRYEIRD